MTVRKKEANARTIKQLCSSLYDFHEGRIVITVHCSKIERVEFLDRSWTRDVWGLEGDGI